MKKILIIGGAGFIGAASARHFLAKGLGVTILDNFSRKGTEYTTTQLQKEFPAVKIVRADIRNDTGALLKAVSEHDAVLHLAAQVAVTTSIIDPRHDFENNILGTFNVLEAVRASANKPSLIYASTNKVYGALEAKPVREAGTRFEFLDEVYQTYGVPETQQLDFHSPYGCSKGAADQYVLDYARIYGLKTVVFRQSCIYGENQFGVEDQGWVAWFTIAAMLGKPLTLYGTGKQVRDVLFVDDLVSLYDKALLNIDKISGRAYNVGGGPLNTLSLIELLDKLNAAGHKISPATASIRAGDQPIFVSDIRAVEKDLGWRPQTTVDQGFMRMHAWLIKNKEVVKGVLES